MNALSPSSICYVVAICLDECTVSKLYMAAKLLQVNGLLEYCCVMISLQCQPKTASGHRPIISQGTLHTFSGVINRSGDNNSRNARPMSGGRRRESSRNNSALSASSPRRRVLGGAIPARRCGCRCRSSMQTTGPASPRGCSRIPTSNNRTHSHISQVGNNIQRGF